VESKHVDALIISRAKLVEQRRALVKRDCSSERNERYMERIVSIQAAVEATDRAINDERELVAKTMPQTTTKSPEMATTRNRSL
jgi:hypothetical protein